MDCSLCQKACPTNAIGPDRFILHAEKCLTYFNEGKDPFPQWLNPSWHNCLVGCLFCQKVCPVNRKYKDFVQDGPNFSEEETNDLLGELPAEELPPETIQKLQSIDLLDYIGVLGRNLKALIGKER